MRLIGEAGTFELRDVFELLDKSLFALENIPDQNIPDGQGGRTGLLAAEIRELLEGREQGAARD